MWAGELPKRLLLILVASIIGMTWAAAHAYRVPSMIAAAAAALALALVAIDVVKRARSRPAPTDLAATARGNATLMALAYAWGGLAMLCVYMLSGLSWRHGWQYGSGMVLIAAGLFAYARNVAKPGSTLATMWSLDLVAKLTGAQGLAAAVALAVLVASGKLATPKGDWAANHIFVAGGLAIVVLSAAAVLSHLRLRSTA